MYYIDVIGGHFTLEGDVSEQLQLWCCLPGESGIRRDGGSVVVGVDAHRIEVRLNGVRPGEVEVSGELGFAVARHQFNTGRLVLGFIQMLDNMRHDQVLGTIVETVDLEVKALDPIISSESELEGIDEFRIQDREIVGRPRCRQ